VFSLEKHTCQEKVLSSLNERNEFLSMITGKKLGSDEVLFFNRRKFESAKKEEIKELIRREYAFMLLDTNRRTGKQNVQDVLKACLPPAKNIRDRNIRVKLAAGRIGLGDKLKTPVKDLTDAEYVFLEYAAARLKQPMLIVIDAGFSGLNPAAVEVVCRQLKQDCLNKTATAIVLRRNEA